MMIDPGRIDKEEIAQAVIVGNTYLNRMLEFTTAG
jgi:hypothetical protein